MPNLVKKEELCFLLLENDILKNKLRFQSTPLQHKFINLLDDLYKDKSNLTRNSDDIMICIARLCPTNEVKILYKIITGNDITKNLSKEHENIYKCIFKD